MILSDISIRRPVFATVLSLLLVVLGVIAFTRLTLRELPAIDPPIVSVEVSYPGASAAVVETRITQVLEDSLSGIEGVESLDSRSRNGEGSISIEFSLNREIEAAANDVRDAVSRVLDRLPPEADPPEIEKAESDSEVILWLNMRSTRMDTMQLTDYAQRYVVDRLSSIDGVARVQVGGQQQYAMRIWLDSQALAARGLTVTEIEAALRRENVELPAGRLESADRDFTLRVQRGYRSPEDFARIALTKGADGYIVRLGDVAQVERSSAERRAYFRSNGEPNIGLGVVRTSTANSLEVARAARLMAEEIQSSLPEGTTIFPAYDSTMFIEASVERVFATLFEAMALVIVVIYLFLGSARSALIPAVTIPVCLVTAFAALWAFGFTINLLTLLAIVLCIGLVVDDAIVVLENIQRRADLGEPSLVAAKRGTAQVAFAVIATTTVLVSVFLPIGLMEGNTGRLFRELSVALASAVAISAFVALSLTPMMSSKLVRAHTREPRGLNRWIQARLRRVAEGYARQICRTIGKPAVFGVILVASAALSYLLFSIVPKELAPTEDRGVFSIMIEGPEGAGFDYTVAQAQKVESLMSPYVGEDKPIQRLNTRVPGGFGNSEEMHTGRVIVFLQDWDKRDVTTSEVVEELRGILRPIPSVRAVPQVRTGLVRSGGQQLQIVLGGPDYEELAQWRDRMLARMADNPGLRDPDSDYKETRPQLRVQIDYDRAADLGVSNSDIGTTLETMMGSRRVTTFVESGEEYDVILQAKAEDRVAPSNLENLYVRSQRSGELVPLSSLVTLREVAEPGTFNRFNRLRAITVSAGLMPGYTLGEAIQWMERTAAQELPEIAQIDYKGESREYKTAGGAVLFTFAMALLIVYLVLAAQFESFIHPFVIMLTVPLAVLGALIGLWISGGTLNLFSQIGIVMLIGLAAKNGILIVEFANQLRDEGRTVNEAIVEAASIRLRPILMTAIATIMGATPLVLSGGPGSASRSAIGVVVISGVAFSTLLSLYVIPSFYALLAPYTRSPDALAKKLEKLEGETPEVSGHA
jgi:multidrug efflux pump